MPKGGRAIELSRTSRGKDAACRGPQGAGVADPGVLNRPSDQHECYNTRDDVHFQLTANFV